MRANPNEPGRCPSIDPYDSLQCGRSVHEDDRCHFGGIAWTRGTPRRVSAEERLKRIRALASEHANCGCPTPWWLAEALS